MADSSFAALELLGALRRHVTLVTRLRLKGRRLPSLLQVLADPHRALFLHLDAH